ncbi:MAG: Bax inhibitor-1/YccA family protein [Gammaproteobacteria bacterium]
MDYNSVASPRTAAAGLEINKVLKNTYLLLSATIIFSAVTAFFSMSMGMSVNTYLYSVIGAFLLGIFVLPRTANSSAGIGVIFLITGLLGFGLGPIINYYLQAANGAQIVTTALGGTGIIFLGLSGYVLTTKKDFTFMAGFLMTGMMVILLGILANLFLNIPAFSLAISAGVIMLMSGFILFDTSRIVRGGETNYIMATYGMYLSIFNIFIHLLNILGFMGDD